MIYIYGFTSLHYATSINSKETIDCKLSYDVKKTVLHIAMKKTCKNNYFAFNQ